MDPRGDNGMPVVLAAAFEQAKEGVLLVDASGYIRFLNPSAGRICGRRQADLLDQPVTSIWRSSELRPEKTGIGGAHYWESEIPHVLHMNDPGSSRVELSHSTVAMAETAWHLFLLRQVTDRTRPAWQRVSSPPMVDGARQAVIAINQAGHVVDVSGLALQWFGYARDELVGTGWRRLLTPARGNRQAWRRVSAMHDDAGWRHEEWRVRTRRGDSFWVSGRTCRVREANGEYGGHITLLARRPEGARLRALQMEALDHSIRQRPRDEILNLICWRLGDLMADAVAAVVLIDDAGWMRSVIAPGLPADYRASLEGVSVRSVSAGAGLAAHQGHSQWTPDIEQAPEWTPYCPSLASMGLKTCWSQPIRTKTGRIVGVLCLHSSDLHTANLWFRHVAEMSAALCALIIDRARSRQDSPQWPRPRRMQDALWWRIERAVEQAAIDSTPMAFVLANMDGFRMINERLGRMAGDRLLDVVADRFRDYLRPLDPTGHLGSDEFVMMLPECDATQAHAVVRRLMSALEKPVRFENRLLQLSASFGISLYPQDGLDADTLYQQAIMAMARVKAAGGDGYRFHSLLG